LQSCSEICRIGPRCDLAPPSDKVRPKKPARADRAIVDQAALLARENDDVVVDGVSETNLGLGPARREDQVLGAAADAADERAEREDWVPGELALLG
jgi:hypothetical protein